MTRVGLPEELLCTYNLEPCGLEESPRQKRFKECNVVRIDIDKRNAIMSIIIHAAKILEYSSDSPRMHNHDPYLPLPISLSASQ